MSNSAAVWTEHRTPEGRPYWYHTHERRSVWEKPSELKTARERALEATPWKEYKSGDRSYYVHSVTKQSTWTLPAELKQILDQYPVDGPAVASASHAPPAYGGNAQSPAMAQSPVNGAPSPAPATGHRSPHGSTPLSTRTPGALSPNAGTRGGSNFGAQASGHASGSNTPLAGSAASPPNPAGSARGPTTLQTMSGVTELNFKGDKEAAEAAFIQLLEQTGVDVDWTWETTMRSIITNPLYKALKTIAERKAAFHKHIDALRRKRAEEAAARLEQLKPQFRMLLDGDARIKSYSSFATAKKLLGDTAVWKQADSDKEAQAVFTAAMTDRRQAEREAEEKLRTRNKEMLLALLKTFEADVFTRWRDAHRTILESQEYTEDAHLGEMDMADMLAVFEELIESIEKDAEAAKRAEAEARRRKERQNRDAFRALLRKLQAEGKIRARSTWGEVFPLLKDHDDFLRAVGQPGSTPLEMFFDLVDDLDQELERQTADALQHASKSGHQVTPTTTQAEFLAWTAASGVPEPTLRQIYSELVAYLAEEQERKAAEERRRLERKHRHRIEDLRYALKKLDPALDLDASFETIRPRLSELVEYKDALAEDERIPEWAWDKFVRRQQEKLAEGDRPDSDSRKRKEPPTLTGPLASEAAADQHSATAQPKRVRRDDESEPEEGEV